MTLLFTQHLYLHRITLIKAILNCA